MISGLHPEAFKIRKILASKTETIWVKPASLGHVADPHKELGEDVVDAAFGAFRLAILGSRANPRTLPNRGAFDDLVIV